MFMTKNVMITLQARTGWEELQSSS